MRKSSALLLVALLGLAGVFVVQVQAGTITDTSTRQYAENFDALATGSEPCTGISNPSVCYYFIGHLGGAGSNQVETAPTGTGFSGKSWGITDAAVPYTVRLVNSGTGVNLCTTGQTNSVDILAPDLTATDVREIRWHSGTISNAVAPANSFGLRLTGVGILGGTNTANFFAHGATQATTTSGNMVNTVTTAIHLEASQVNCNNTGCVIFTFTGLTGIASPLTWCATNGDPFTGTFNNIAVADTASIAAATVHIDNYVWAGAPLNVPTVTGVSPISGPTTGGTTVYVYGSNFDSSPVPVVRFCETAVTTGNTVVDSSSQIHVITPANGAAQCAVTVTNNDGQVGTCAGCFTYSVNGSAPDPCTQGATPTSGSTAGGTNVSVVGNDFRPGAILRFGDTDGFENHWIDRQHMTGISPQHTAGTVSLYVVNVDPNTGARTTQPLLSSCLRSFTFTAGDGGPGGPIPTIVSIAPSQGPASGGTTVTITGTNYRAGATATFGGSNGFNPVVLDSSHLRIDTPPHAAGQVNVVVVNADGTSVNRANGFTYTGTSDGGGPGGFGTPSALTTIPNSGRALSLDSNGNAAVIFHVTGAGDANVATLTTDGAATWNSFALNSFPMAAGSTVYRDAGLIDASKFGLIARDLATNNVYFQHTENGGTTFATATAATGSTSVAVDGGFSKYVLVISGASGNPVARVSTDNGATWANTAGAMGGSGSAHVMSDVLMETATTWRAYGIDSGASSIPREWKTVDAGATWTVSNIQDLINPLTGFGTSIQGTTDGQYVSFVKGVAGDLYYGFHTSSSTWTFFQVAAAANHLVEDTTTSGSGEPGLENCGADAMLVYKPNVASGQVKLGTLEQDDSQTYESAVSGGSDSTRTNAPKIFVIGTTAYTAYRDVASQLLTIIPRTQCGTAVATTSSITVATNQLSGFDVDPGNVGMITRQRNGPDTEDAIIAYEPTTLVETGSYPEALCERPYGVATVANPSGYSFHSFVDCGMDGAVDTIHIRSGVMGEASFAGTICARDPGNDWCERDINASQWCNGVDRVPDMIDMGKIEIAHWDFTYSAPPTTSVLNGDRVLMVWTFTKFGTGEIGILANYQKNNACDPTSETLVNYSNSGTPDDFCSWTNAGGFRTYNNETFMDQDTEPTAYMAAVSATGPTRIYHAFVDHAFAYFTTNDGPTVRIDPVNNGNPLINNAVALGCGDYYVFVLKSDGAHWVPLKGPRSATSIHDYPVQGTPRPRSATLSLNGVVGSYGDDLGIHVVNLGENREVVLLPLPASPIVRVSMDSTGQTLYVAAESSITVYDIATAAGTTDDPPGAIKNPDGTPVTGPGGQQICQDAQGSGTVSPECSGTGGPGTVSGCQTTGNCGVPTTTPAPQAGGGTGPLASAAVAAGNAFGGGVVGGALIIAIIFILVFAGAGMVILDKAPVMGAVIGAGLGFAYSIFSGLIPAVITFGLIALAVGLGGMKFFSGRGSDS